jgi:alpha-glucosidase
VAAQSDDPGSTLTMTRLALQHRRALAGLPVAWVDDLPEGVLGLRRGDGFVCLVNFGDEPVEVPPPGDLLPVLSSFHPAPAGGPLPARSAVWLAAAVTNP